MIFSGLLKKFKQTKKISELENVFNNLIQKIQSIKGDYGIEQVFEIIGHDLKKLGISSIFSVYDKRGQNIVFRYFQIAENFLGLPLSKEFPIKNFTHYNSAAKNKKTIFCKNQIGELKKIFPELNDFFEKNIKLQINSILSPLIIKDDVLGFFEILSPDINLEEDLMIADSFAKNLTEEITNLILFNEIKKSEERYRDLFENAKEGFFIFNGRKKRYIEVNTGFCEISGYTREELLQMNYLIIFDLDERLRMNTYVKNRLEGFHGTPEAPSEYETKILTKQGNVKYILLKITRIINTDEWFCIIYDKTEKRLAEKILKENEEMYRKLVETAGSIILRRLIDGTITFVNEYAKKFFGFTKKELIGKNIVGTIVPPVDSSGQNLAEMIKNISQAPQDYANNQSENIKKDGTRAWIAWTNKGIYDADNNLVEILGVGIDMTDKKQAEETLSESEAKFRRLAELMSDWVWEMNEMGIITYVSPKVKDILGYELEEIIGHSLFEFMTPDEANNLSKYILESYVLKKPYAYIEYTAIHKNGQEIYIESSGTPIFNIHGQSKGYQGINRDITQEKLNQEKIRKLSEFNQRILDNVPVSIVVLDKNGQIVAVNGLAQKWMNKTSEEASGRSIFDTNTMKKSPELNRRYQKLLTTGEPVHLDNILYRPENEKEKIIYLNFIAVPLFDSEDKIEGAISMALDNTNIIQAKLKLENLNKELEEKVEERTKQLNGTNQQLNNALEAKIKFIADASHELRTPLTIIQGNLHLIKHEIKNCSPETEENIDLIKKEVKHMTDILSDLTMLATADTSDEQLSCGKVDLALLISAISRSLKILADQRGIKIKYSWPDKPLEIIGDEDKLEKVFYNLIRNAIRYNKNNGWIKIKAEPNETGINIYVDDGGIGIPEKDLTNVFERFYRVDKARSRKDGGSGLGLAICKSIIEAHQGIISAESVLGEGSTFKVWLPYNCKNSNQA